MRSFWMDGARARAVEIEGAGDARWRVRVDDAEIEVAAERIAPGLLRLTTASGITVAEVTAVGARRFVSLGGMDFVLERASQARTRGAAEGGSLEAPMPGVVTRVMVKGGDEVRKGQPLLAIEAMKMEHVLRAPRDGRVKAVAAKAGEMAQSGVALIELEG